MRIAHISDTHLGCIGNGIQRDVPDPFRPGYFIKQREADIFSAFAAAVDQIIASVKPDLVIHSGDLFDTSLPKASSLDFAMQQFARLYQAKIPSILVEGDHSAPRTRGNGNVVHILRYIPGVTVVAPGQETIRIGPLTIHAVSHQALEGRDVPALEQHLESNERNILVAHGVADGHRLFKTHKNAFPIAIEQIASWFDYIALGHCHRFAQVPGTDNAFYAGSLAMVSPQDFQPDYEFGFNVITFTADCMTVQRETISTRPMRHYGLDDAHGLSVNEIFSYIQQQASAIDCRGAHCRVVVENIDPLVRRQMSQRMVEELFEGTASIDVHLRTREARWEATAAAQGLVSGGSIEARFGELVEQMDGDSDFKAGVLTAGHSLLDEAAAKVLEASVREDRDT